MGIAPTSIPPLVCFQTNARAPGSPEVTLVLELVSVPIQFFANCPKCVNPRLQDAHTRQGLLTYLGTGRTIEAYCNSCEVLWPITDEQRRVLAGMIGRD